MAVRQKLGGIMLALLWFALLSGQNQAAAQFQPTLGQNAILDEVIHNDGYLTEAMHGQFWAEMSAEVRSGAEAKEAMLIYYARKAGLLLDYRIALWESLQGTFMKKSPFRTPGYTELRDRFLAANEPYRTNARLMRAVRIGEGLIENALTGKPQRGFEGEQVVTLDVANLNLIQDFMTRYRYQSLMDPGWAARPIEWNFGHQHLKLIWPHISYPRHIGHNGRETAEQTPLTVYSRPDRFHRIYVWSEQVPKPARDPDRMLKDVSRKITDLGWVLGVSQPERWKGYRSLVFISHNRISKEQQEGVVRLVHVPPMKRVFIMIAASGVSPERAVALGEELDEALEIVLPSKDADGS